MILMTVAYLLIGFGVYAQRVLPAADDQEIWASATCTVSYLAAIPAALGVVGMILVSRSSDRTGERVWHVTCRPCWAAVALLVTAAFVGNPLLELIAPLVVGFGISSCLPMFWNLADRVSRGRQPRRPASR